MRIPSKGEIVRTEIAHAGEIVIVPCDSLRLNDVLGNKLLLPRETWSDNPLPLLRTTIAPEKPEQRERLLNALTEIADTDPLLRYEVDAVTHEIILSFWAGYNWKLSLIFWWKNISSTQLQKNLPSSIWRGH